MSVTMRGSRWMPAPPDVIWAALHDVDCLRHCIPNCRSLVRETETRFAVGVAVQVGPVRVAVDGHVDILESASPKAFALHGAGGAGLLGTASGTLRICLCETKDGCRLDYSVEASSEGPLVVLGPYVVSGIGKALADQFTQSLAARVARQGSPQAAALAARSKPTISSSV